MIISAVKCLPETSNKIFIGQENHFIKYNIDKKIKEFYPKSKVLGINYLTEGQACTTDLGFSKF